jgi:hypothetical protein
VYRSTEKGDSWTQSGLSNTYVYAFAVSATQCIFAGGHGGVSYSTDNGATWMHIGLTNLSILSLAINSNGHIFAGGAGVYRSTDNGVTWTQTGLSISTVQSFAFDSNGYIFAGTDSSGVYRSTDNGDTWMPINTGLTGRDVRALAINSNGYLFAGTWDIGIFRSVQSTTITFVKEICGEIPTSFSLEQNYPNPFNPETIIEFRVPNDGWVALKVYDVLGREVATPVNEWKRAGNYKVTFDARHSSFGSLTSGIYFYRLQTAGANEVKRMVLLR